MMWRHSLVLAVMPVIFLVVCFDTNHAEIPLPSQNLTMPDVRAESAEADDGLATEPSISSTDDSAKPAAPPTALAGRYLDSRRIEVTWLPPEQDSYRDRIISYKIYYQPTDQEEDVPMIVTADGESRRYILRDVSMWTEYKIWMIASTAMGDGPAADPIVVRSDESGTVPKRPRNLGVIVKNATTIDVDWQSPSQTGQNGTIRGYLIFIQQVDERNEPTDDTHKYNIMDGTATHYTITNLEPDTHYNIRVGAYTRSADGELTEPIKVKTFPGLPLAPRLQETELFEEQGKVQVQLQWKRPQQTYGVLRGYRIMYGKRGSAKEQLILKEMLPRDEFVNIEDRGMSYEFRIAAFNSRGLGVEAVKEVQIWPEGVPTGPPQNISYRFESPLAVRIAWDPPRPDRQNGQITGYTVHYETNGTVVKTNVTQPYFDFDRMERRKEYTFRISARTSKGEGKVSQSIVIATPAEVPPPPENVHAAAVNDTHAEVRWTPIPYTPAMQIHGYRVSFKCVEEITLKPMCNHAGSLDVEYNSAILPNMEPGRNYTVMVAGKTQRSVGQASKKVVFRMAPEEVPKDVHVVNVTKDSITLRWKPPLVVIPTRYSVSWQGKKRYLDQDGSMQIRQMPRGRNRTTSTEITLHYLRPCTTYSIHLMAIPQDDRDTPAVRLDVTTATDVPPVVSPPTFIKVTEHGTIRIQLQRATEEFGPIKHYLVVVVPSQLAIKHPDNFTLSELTRHEPTNASGQQLPGNSSFSYIAANFSRETLPRTFGLGDGNVYEMFYNRPIIPGHHYKVFVRAYVDSPNNVRVSWKNAYPHAPLVFVTNKNIFQLEPLYTSSPFSEDFSTDRQVNPETGRASTTNVSH